MTSELQRVLRHWPCVSERAVAEPVTHSAGFSGANVWRVDDGGQSYALRRWQSQMEVARLGLIHVIQSVLGLYGPPVVPKLQKLRGAMTIVTEGGRLWELATWRPGTADFREQPSDARLTAAMCTLAAIHLAADNHISTPWPLDMEALRGRDSAHAARRRSDSAARRVSRLLEIVHESRWFKPAMILAPPEAEPLVGEAVALIKKLAPCELGKARAWQDTDLPLQYRLGDVHHDHVLFVGDDVTGIVDFGAVDFDAPAGDVARLLGSLVGDDRERWRQGLSAYESVRPMSDIERQSVAFFDSTGTVVSAANWLEWLWPRDPATGPAIANRAAALARLERLVERLRVLAGGAA